MHDITCNETASSVMAAPPHAGGWVRFLRQLLSFASPKSERHWKARPLPSGRAFQRLVGVRFRPEADIAKSPRRFYEALM